MDMYPTSTVAKVFQLCASLPHDFGEPTIDSSTLAVLEKLTWAAPATATSMRALRALTTQQPVENDDR